MCHLTAHLPAIFGAAIMDRLNKGANKKAVSDPRSRDQFRADAFSALLLAEDVPDGVDACQRIQPVIAVTIPATERARNTGETTTPASLDGRMLVDTATVGAWAVDVSTWQRLFTHPVTGLPVAIDRYRPTELQRQFIQLRDGTCRWPGCARSASGCDVDHSQDFALGGETRLDNLACLCRHHHVMKHATKAKVRQLPGAMLELTLGGGRVIRTEPEILPGCEPPPFAHLKDSDLWAWPAPEPDHPPGDPDPPRAVTFESAPF